MTDRSARHRTRPEHDAGPRHATGRILNVLAVHYGLSRCRTEEVTPAETLGKMRLATIPATGTDLVERLFVRCMVILLIAREPKGDGAASSSAKHTVAKDR